ncbi:pkd2, partial [Symbiodinium sp. KB8]
MTARSVFAQLRARSSSWSKVVSASDAPIAQPPSTRVIPDLPLDIADIAAAITTMQHGGAEDEGQEESDDQRFPRMGSDVKKLRVAVACHAAVILETGMVADSSLNTQPTPHGGERRVSSASAGGASGLGDTTDSAAFRRQYQRHSEVPVFFANSAAVMPKPLLCSCLLVTLTYWFCFVYSQVVHQDTAASWEIRASFKNFEEIMDRRSSKLKSAGGDDQPDDHVFKDWGDMYSWFRAGYVPLLWEEGPHGRGLLANRIRLIGGVRFGKEVAKPVDCSAGRQEKEWVNLVYNHSCFEDVPDDESSEQETYWLDVAQDVNTTLAHIDWLQSSGWISDETTEVTIQAFFFNAQSQTFVLSQMQVTLEHTGYLHGKLETLMVPSDIYAQHSRFWVSNVAADVLAGFCLAACALVEALMWRQAVKHRQLKAFIFNIYRLSNLLTLVGGVLYLAYYGVLSSSVDQIGIKLHEYTKTQAYPERPPGAGSGPWEARYDLLNDIHAFTEDAAVWYRGAQWICFWYMLVLLVKFGEGLPVSPRLMIFVNTLYDAVGSIFYFFIVFFVVFANFAMGAHFLFGHILYSWSTTFLPFASSLRVLMGDFDFMGMYDIAPVSSVSWFMLFIVMVAFVLVNLFIAIVTDSYQRVHAETVGNPHE